MKWQWSLVATVALAVPVLAQEVPQGADGSGANPSAIAGPGPLYAADPVVQGRPTVSTEGGFLTGERSFPNFIGYLSSPTTAIDPRSLTQIIPIVGSVWTPKIGPVPAGDIQVYGPGMSVAFSERLCAGLSQGGYATSNFRQHRDGFLNMGGFVQFEAIRNVDCQFLATGGLRWEAPTGEASVFQGHGPAYLAPYVTVGKEFRDFHLLMTAGYEFAAGSGKATTDTYYGNVHLDHRTFGWLYPTVECNWTVTSTNLNLDLPQILGRFSFDPDLSGTLVTIAPGVNAVLIQNRLEMGACYQTPLWSERGLRFNEVLLKMILRY